MTQPNVISCCPQCQTEQTWIMMLLVKVKCRSKRNKSTDRDFDWPQNLLATSTTNWCVINWGISCTNGYYDCTWDWIQFSQGLQTLAKDIKLLMVLIFVEKAIKALWNMTVVPPEIFEEITPRSNLSDWNINSSCSVSNWW